MNRVSRRGRDCILAMLVIVLLACVIAMPVGAAVPPVNTAAFSNGAGSSSLTPIRVGMVAAGLVCVSAIIFLGWFWVAGYESWTKGNRDLKFMDFMWLGVRAIVIVTFFIWVVT